MKSWYKQAKLFWGKAGSGVLYVCMEDETALLVLRSAEVEDAHTWGIPGGAVSGTEGMYDEEEIEQEEFDEERIKQSAEKEVEEELGYIPSNSEEIGKTVFQSGNFSYTTYIVSVPKEEKERINQSIRLNWENQAFGWYPFDKLPPNIHEGVAFTLRDWERQKQEKQEQRKANCWNTFKKTARYGGSEKERGLWYHATPVANVPKILSEGLIPDPKKRVWGKEEHGAASFGSPSLASLGGIYLSASPKDAWMGVRDRITHATLAVVIMDLQPRTLITDEDDISRYLADVAHGEGIAVNLYLAKELGIDMEYLVSARSDYIQTAMELILGKLSDEPNPEMAKRLRELVRSGFSIALNRQMAHVNPDVLYKHIFANLYDLNPTKHRAEYQQIIADESKTDNDKVKEIVDLLNVPTIGGAEDEFGAYMDLVTRVVKNMTRASKVPRKYSVGITGRSLEPIGFSGSNRIIGIVEVPMEIGHEIKPPPQLKLLYGSLPQEFLTEWEAWIKSPVEVVKSANRLKWMKTARYGGSEQERGIWYHGTSKSKLPYILSQGLIPNPKARAWSEERGKGSFQGPSLASLGGIYLTQNLGTAYSSAGPENYDPDNGKVFVIVEAQPRSFITDEDDVSSALAWPSTSEFMALELFFARELGTNESFVEDSRDDYVAKGLRRLQRQLKTRMDPRLKSRLREIIKNGWSVALDRQVAHAAGDDYRVSSSFYRNISPEMTRDLDVAYAEIRALDIPEEEKERRYSDFVRSVRPQIPDIQTAERNYAQYADQVTRTMKNLARPEQLSEDWNPVARSLEPIGFSGSNKIVAIVEEIRNREREKQGDYKGTQLKVWYGEPPAKFFDEYKQFAGSYESVI